ncbi:MAG: septum formation initiator family protein [Firmicutes bacterium]|nr:septum formation initiator family protein [Bacillota bacterium]
MKGIKSPTRLLAVVFISIFALIIGFSVHKRVEVYQQLKSEESLLNIELAEEKERTDELKSTADYYKSSAYIEQVARNQLGLIKPGEIVFIRNN